MVNRKKIDGWDSNYRYGVNPKIDTEVDKLNSLIKRYGKGGITLALKLKLSGDTESDGFLELPEGMPEEKRREAEDIAMRIGKIMVEKINEVQYPKR